MSSFIMYRCDTCGKWSHAKKKPKGHQRGTTETPSDVRSIISAEFTPEGESFYWVKCGPFSAYVAHPMEDEV